jgi:hypothetical protein
MSFGVLQSDWSKGFNFGLELGLEISIGFQLLFREEYADKFKIYCRPEEYSESRFLDLSGKFLLMPIHPKCVRGFMVQVGLGVGAGAVVVEANVYTAFERIKSTSIVMWGQKDTRLLDTMSGNRRNNYESFHDSDEFSLNAEDSYDPYDSDPESHSKPVGYF